MTTDNELTPAHEDYLEAIYIISRVNGSARVADIARFLDVKMPSVSSSMKKLSDMGYIKYEKRHLVELTSVGEEAARAVNRRHEELFSFFHDVLGVERKEAQDSACKSEHVLSPKVVEAIIRMRQWMTTLPEDIASDFASSVRMTSHLNERKDCETLADARPGDVLQVTGVDTTTDTGKRIVAMGLVPGTVVELVRLAPLGDPMEVKFMGFHLSLRKAEAALVTTSRQVEM